LYNFIPDAAYNFMLRILYDTILLGLRTSTYAAVKFFLFVFTTSLIMAIEFS